MASSSGHHGKKDAHQGAAAVSPAASSSAAQATQANAISRLTLQLLTKHVDPNAQLDEEVEDWLLSYSDNFLEQVIEGACAIAAHRKATSLEVQDIETYLERHCNMWLSNEEKEEPTKVPKKNMASEAHKQRMALIKKTLKKY